MSKGLHSTVFRRRRSETAEGKPQAVARSWRRRINDKAWVRRTIMVLSVAGILYAVLGFVNEAYLHWVDSFWLSGYSDRIAIVIFGTWRVIVERDTYTRRRIGVVTALILALWILFPYLTGSSFFNHHAVGSLWFFAYLVLAFCFGRRVDCAWNCPCVGLRDTAGEPFRNKTIKTDWTWRLRHVKWFFLGGMLLYLVLLAAFRYSLFASRYIPLFWTITNVMYFASFLIIPWTGNRNYCRYMCPWGATYGVLGTLGFYRILADKDQCISCGLCERECDMGIPIMQLIEESGQIAVADCIGCGRCVQACPRNALTIVDIRDYLRAFWRRLTQGSTTQTESR